MKREACSVSRGLEAAASTGIEPGHRHEVASVGADRRVGGPIHAVYEDRETCEGGRACSDAAPARTPGGSGAIEIPPEIAFASLGVAERRAARIVRFVRTPGRCRESATAAVRPWGRQRDVDGITAARRGWRRGRAGSRTRAACRGEGGFAAHAISWGRDSNRAAGGAGSVAAEAGFERAREVVASVTIVHADLRLRVAGGAEFCHDEGFDIAGDVYDITAHVERGIFREARHVVGRSVDGTHVVGVVGTEEVVEDAGPADAGAHGRHSPVGQDSVEREREDLDGAGTRLTDGAEPAAGPRAPFGTMFEQTDLTVGALS